MARGRREDLRDFILAAPWWTGVVAAAVAYVAAALILPAILSGSALTESSARALERFAPVIALLFLLPAPYAVWQRFRLRRQLAQESAANAGSLRALSQLELEKQVAEVLARIGYGVREARECGIERGVHLVATASDERLFVQCRHARDAMLSAAAVLELSAAMAAEGVSAGALVTSGVFSEEAAALAAGRSITLIDGAALEALLSSLREEDHAASATAPRDPPLSVRCPDCGSPMVARAPRRGRSTGEAVWGCSRHPFCSGTRVANVA
jgi:hypothetical protein